MQMVYKVASLSSDPRTQVGALVYDVNDNLLAASCNYALADWLSHDFSKNFVMDHAERAAIRAAAGYCGAQAMKGATLITLGIPCVDCAREIIGWGIKKVIVHDKYDGLTPHKEYFGQVEKLLRLRDVEIVRLSGDFGQLLFDGELR